MPYAPTFLSVFLRYRKDLEVYNTGEMIMLTGWKADRDVIYVGNNQKVR